MSGIERDPEADPGPRRGRGDGDPPPQAGVLGNLPKKRPSVRSPRRSEPKPAAAKPSGEEAASAEEKRVPKPPSRPSGPPPGAEPQQHSPAADLENLARGGIAIAGGAASLGLKVAGRAAAALRDAVERR